MRAGDDLAGLIAAAERRTCRDGDVVVVTQKIVSKAEGAMAPIDPDDPLGHKALVEDAVGADPAPPGRPDHQRDQARVRLRQRRASTSPTSTTAGPPCCPTTATGRPAASATASGPTLGVEVAVIVSDTFGRPWRRGLTDVAIGCAGIRAVVDLRGTEDSRGRELQVTEVCVVDELAGAAELVMGKASGRGRRRRPGRRPGLAGPRRGAAPRSSGPRRRTSSADRPLEPPEPAQHLGDAGGEVGPRLPAEVERGPAGVERGAGQLARAGRRRGTAGRSTPAASAMARVELVDRRLDAGADVAEQPAAPVGGPHEGVDDVVDVDEVAGLARRRRRSCTASRSRSSPAKIATTPGLAVRVLAGPVDVGQRQRRELELWSSR